MSLHSTQVIGGLVGAYDTAIRDNIVFADDGKVYHNVQDAVDNADSYVLIGPGTFDESVTVSTSGLTVEGVGRPALVNGGTTGPAFLVEAPGVTITTVSVQTTAGGGNAFVGINFSSGGSGSSRGQADRVWVRESDDNGIHVQDDDVTVRGVILEDIAGGIDGDGVRSTGGSTDCTFIDVYGMNGAIGSEGMHIDGGDHVIMGTKWDGPGSTGILVDAGATVVNANRIIGAGGDGVHINGENCVVDGNVITGTSGTPIETATPTTVTVGDNHAA